MNTDKTLIAYGRVPSHCELKFVTQVLPDGSIVYYVCVIEDKPELLDHVGGDTVEPSTDYKPPFNLKGRKRHE